MKKQPKINKLYDSKFRAEQIRGFDAGQIKRYDEEIERLKKEDAKIIAKGHDYADKKYRAMQKHLDTKIVVSIDDFSGMFSELSNKVRLEIVKSIIWTSYNQEEMLNMISNLVASGKFRETID